jgi:hypothetical protein
MDYLFGCALLCVLTLGAAVCSAAGEPDGWFLVGDAPAGGLVLGEITALPGLPRIREDSALSIEGTADGKPVPCQFVPPLRPGQPALIVLRVPGAGDHRVRWRVTREASLHPLQDKVQVRTAGAVFTHDVKRLGGLLGRIVFPKSGKVFDTFDWNDRLYDPKLGSFRLDAGGTDGVQVISTGPLCTVVRTRNPYAKPDGTPPESRPEAAYDWLYFHDVPLVYVRADIRQSQPTPWGEIHFLELRYPDESFRSWAGGDPVQTGTFTVTKKSTGFHEWAMLREGSSAIAMLRAGRMLLYDGRGGHGTYLHAYGTEAWRGWSDTHRRTSAWLWIGESADPVARVREALASLPTNGRIVVTTTALREQIDLARKALPSLTGSARRRKAHAVAMAEKLEADGHWQLAQAWLAERPPEGWTVRQAGDLAVTFQRTADGIRCASLLDVATGTELAGAETPLFKVTLRQAKTGKLVTLNANTGWGDVRTETADDGTTLTWAKPGQDGLEGVRVAVTARTDAARSRVSWSLDVANPHDDWGVWRVLFPQVSLAPFASDTRVLIPQAAGVVKADAWRKPVRFKGTYPSGWTSMQFMAAYDAEGRTGLYVAAHDPAACTKDITAETDTQAARVLLSFDHPAPNMGQPRVGFALSGRAVWQILRGDWFDASVIYRDWVRREAGWWPDLTAEGRADTPKWMRDLCLWGLLGGGAEHATKTGKHFADVMEMPVGCHWYSWHEIPFDNDYPHYFPAKKGFAEAVASLQGMPDRPAYVMPYINGRLWDTRDQGTGDREFQKVARPAATKDIQGEFYTEMYGSKESDGSRVKLAAMCPATKLWQERVQTIVLRLMKECGTKAVYIDQIAAAKPHLCFDASHGHPLGGGGWWVEAYGKMLTDLRKAMPDGCMLTTECNAEPYIRWFDGYLTWHWQYDGQVPAFPAVYGGAVQMFGRAYRGGPTKDLAHRMKAGQQLVYGEQIGWIGVGVANEPANAAFLRHVARLRQRLVRFFVAGQMARPPRLQGTMPTITADWQWSGVWPVTTDAVLTGAWEIPREKTLALIFVNVSPEPVTAGFAFDATAYGLPNGKVRLTRVTPDGEGESQETPARFAHKLTFEPGKAWTWVVSPAGR